jgi:hypothetical protein
MFFLDRYPAPPPYRETPAEVFRTMQEICEQASYLEGALCAIIGPLLFTHHGDPLTNVAQAASSLHDELQALDRRLDQESWPLASSCLLAS